MGERLGFSTGKGFLAIVDNAEHANNATNAQNTNFSNSGFVEFDLDIGFFSMDATYEIIYEHDSTWYHCIFSVWTAWSETGQTMYLPTVETASHTLTPYIRKVDNLIMFNGVIDNNYSFYDSGVKSYYRAIG